MQQQHALDEQKKILDFQTKKLASLPVLRYFKREGLSKGLMGRTNVTYLQHDQTKKWQVCLAKIREEYSREYSLMSQSNQ